MSVHAAMAVDGIAPTRGECSRVRAEADFPACGVGHRARLWSRQITNRTAGYDPFSIPLALSVAATLGPERQEISDFPAAALSDFTPAAPANET